VGGTHFGSGGLRGERGGTCDAVCRAARSREGGGGVGGFRGWWGGAERGGGVLVGGWWG